MKTLTEYGYIAKNTGETKRGIKPWFAISTLHWQAGLAKAELMSGLDGVTTWPKMKRDGWHIVKVKITEVKSKR